MPDAVCLNESCGRSISIRICQMDGPSMSGYELTSQMQFYALT